MILLLMRHGIAEDLPVESPARDFDRELTDKGRKRLRDMVRLLKKSGLEPTHYFSSPRVRAVQTAEEVRAAFGSEAPILEVQGLDYATASWDGAVEEIARLTGDEPEAVVFAASHEPICGQFIAHACAGHGEGFPLKKGAVAALQWHGPLRTSGAKLLFYVTPKFARRLAGEELEESVHQLD